MSFRSSAGCIPYTWGIAHTSHKFWSYIKHLPEDSCSSQHAGIIIIIITFCTACIKLKIVPISQADRHFQPLKSIYVSVEPFWWLTGILMNKKLQQRSSYALQIIQLACCGFSARVLFNQIAVIKQNSSLHEKYFDFYTVLNLFDCLFFCFSAFDRVPNLRRILGILILSLGSLPADQNRSSMKCFRAF